MEVCVTSEIKARIVKGDRSAGASSKIFRSKNVSRRAEVYKVILRLIVAYGSNTWVTNRRCFRCGRGKYCKRYLEGKTWRCVVKMMQGKAAVWCYNDRDDGRQPNSNECTEFASNGKQKTGSTQYQIAATEQLKEKGIRNWKARAWGEISNYWICLFYLLLDLFLADVVCCFFVCNASQKIPQINFELYLLILLLSLEDTKWLVHGVLYIILHFPF